ncbi:MAG: hypothetical protein LBP98_10110, partial [Tannerella sp.]|nr:hypothetical protein [Tannerella sp.]
LKSIQIDCYKNSGKDRVSPQCCTNRREVLYERRGFMYEKAVRYTLHGVVLCIQGRERSI